MLQITEDEKREIIANCDHLKNLKCSPQSPYAFTEQGVAMLSSVLRSQRAIHVDIEIMRTFVRLKKLLASHAELAGFLLCLSLSAPGPMLFASSERRPSNPLTVVEMAVIIHKGRRRAVRPD